MNYAVDCGVCRRDHVGRAKRVLQPLGNGCVGGVPLLYGGQLCVVLEYMKDESLIGLGSLQRAVVGGDDARRGYFSRCLRVEPLVWGTGM